MVVREVGHLPPSEAFEADRSRCNLDLPRGDGRHVYRRALHG